MSNCNRLPQLIRFGRAITGDLAQAERREWWLSNGLGGYAAGTVALTLTRRYHGLLVAPVFPPLGRFLLLAKADITLWLGEQAFPLYDNRWRDGVCEPGGHLQLESFQLQGRMPVWRFAVAGLTLELRIWMEHGQHATWIAVRLVHAPGDERPARISLRLLASARDHHGGESHPLHASSPADGSALVVSLPNACQLQLAAEGGSLQPQAETVRGFQLPVEAERGLPDEDAHTCIGVAQFSLQGQGWKGLRAALVQNTSADPTPPRLFDSLQLQLKLQRQLLSQACHAHPLLEQAPDWIRQLVLAADSFLFTRPVDAHTEGRSVIAGYPWFGDWGRDTMIALPGLTLACGRAELARDILLTFARYLDQGMLPNLFPGNGDRVEYNTVDAALWYIEAWRAYVQASGDLPSLAQVMPALESIIFHYRTGTRYGIGMDVADGLIHAGAEGAQLTWMDAKLGDWVVTPRHGKPVEINALWYNALCSMASFRVLLKQDDSEFLKLAEHTALGFQRYRDGRDGALLDVLDGPDGHDASVRPNQIYAVSLHYSPLRLADQKQVVAQVRTHLLTSHGLRSLDPQDARYRGRYVGGVWERDSSITRVRCGAFYWGLMRWRNTVSPVMPRWRSNGCRGWRIICTMAVLAPSAKFSTATHRIHRAVVRPRPGQWPARWMPGCVWNNTNITTPGMAPEARRKNHGN